ncbi:LPXTG cell wall anchor domain-containing protein [Oceanobacillus sp. CAU 1775]
MKTSNLSFLSGLIAFALILTLITPMTTTYAAEADNDDSVRDDVYDVRDDVYGEDDEYYEDDETVTESAYKYLWDIDEVENGIISLPHTGTVIISNETLTSIDHDTHIHMSNQGAELWIPIDTLKQAIGDDFRVVVSLYDFTSQYDNIKGLVSNLYEVNLGVGMKTYEEEFSEPFGMVININPNKVSNWEDLVLRSFDESGNYIDLKSQEMYYNTITGEVIFDVYQSGKYSLVEVPGSGDHKDSGVDESEDEYEETVTDNAYRNLWDKDELAKYLDNKGNVNLPNTGTLLLDSKVLKDLNDDAKVNLSIDGVHLSIPASVLKQIVGDDFRVSVSLEDVTLNYEEIEGLVSSVYRFNLGVGLETYDGEFSEPFILTFKVDPSKVTNWNDLVLRYFEEDGTYTDYKNQVLSYNAETGEVVVEVYHFSEYGIVEVPGSGDQAAGDGTTDSTEDEESDETATTGTNGPGNVLPQTATSMFNLLAIGLGLILTGLVLFIRNKKTVAVN